MSIQHIIPTLQALPSADKLRAIQWLVNELAQEEKFAKLESSQVHEIWSPHQAFDAADKLSQFLEDEKKKRREQK